MKKAAGGTKRSITRRCPVPALVAVLLAAAVTVGCAFTGTKEEEPEGFTPDGLDVSSLAGSTQTGPEKDPAARGSFDTPYLFDVSGGDETALNYLKNRFGIPADEVITGSGRAEDTAGWATRLFETGEGRVPALGDFVCLSQELMDRALLGVDREALLTAWGQPDRSITQYQDVFTAPEGAGQIRVDYDGNYKVVKVQRTAGGVPNGYVLKTTEQGQFTLSNGLRRLMKYDEVVAVMGQPLRVEYEFIEIHGVNNYYLYYPDCLLSMQYPVGLPLDGEEDFADDVDKAILTQVQLFGSSIGTVMGVRVGDPVETLLALYGFDGVSTDWLTLSATVGEQPAFSSYDAYAALHTDGTLFEQGEPLHGLAFLVKDGAVSSIVLYSSWMGGNDDIPDFLPPDCLGTQEQESRGEFTLSLIAGEREAFLNGEAVSLSAAPFVENEEFFFPLKDVVELLGGTYTFDGRLARVELLGESLVYELGVPALTSDGERWEITTRESFSAQLPYVAADGDFAPRLKDGVLFIPASFRVPGGPAPVLGSGRSYPEEGLVILGGFENELGTREVRLNDPYALLPESLRSGAVCDGAVGRVLSYEVRRYRTEDLEIYVMYDESGEDPEAMDGKVCALRITGPGCSTPRGLRVGDDARRPVLLYGPCYSTDFQPYGMEAELENGAVASILFSSRYYGSQLE